MINKDVLTKYVRIVSGYDTDPNLTLVDFSLNEEQRNIVNLVNEEAKKDKKIANLLDDLKYSNNKMDVIEKYFNNQNETKVLENNVGLSNVKNYGREKIDNYGFINLSSLSMIIGTVVLVLVVAIAIGA